MTPRTSLLRTPAHIVPVLGAVALICGLVAGANLGIDGRQNLLLAAGAIACSVLAIAPGRSIPIRLTIATSSLLAAALVWIGIDLLA
ncbi:MAG: hypothetical protein KC438_14700, partial [Thermomicrobiales bacterium]|nr:hypothetical protein [Thermomicrobiales bacterium]